jgi:hypothetical protein
MGLVETLYVQEDDSLKRIWDIMPFNLFAPTVPLFGFRAVREAIDSRNADFFINNIANDFFPDKAFYHVPEAGRQAMDRGIIALNTLCQTHLPEVFPVLAIPQIEYPFDPLKFMTEAKEKLMKAKSGRHKQARLDGGVREYWIKTEQGPQKVITDRPAAMPIDSRLMLQAYSAARAWGLGRLVLIIDESPEVFHSASYGQLIDDWFNNQFRFENPQQVSPGVFSWDNRSGVRVYGTGEHPFKQRAKIFDEQGNIKYTSILMKMFLKQGFLDRIHDTYGVELIVENEEAVKKLISHIRREVRGTTTLEKYERVEHPEPPAFFCDKFLLRVPVRVVGPTPPRKDHETIKEPLKKYIRLPVEVQIRALDKIDPAAHALYKQQQYMRVFPLWYPRQIYEPILAEVKS